MLHIYIFICVQCHQAKVVSLSSSSLEIFKLGLASGHTIVMAYANVHNAHVGGEEVDQAISASAWQAIEWIAHGLAIRIQAIAHSTVAGSIAAAAYQLLINLKSRRI